ncbi:hypothetical protein ACA910_010864 [Epithemia clementina (nom. ined.)]
MGSETVRFNVGGTVFEVAQSLLDQFPTTMLARMASETWHQKTTQHEPIFIERDSKRFRYVLDYMRDGKVMMPYGVATLESMEAEFAYYGFDRVSSDAIHISSYPVYDSVDYMHQLEAKAQAKVKQCDEELQCMSLALSMFQEFRNKNQTIFYLDHFATKDPAARYIHNKGVLQGQKYLNQYLAIYGLECSVSKCVKGMNQLAVKKMGK